MHKAWVSSLLVLGCLAWSHESQAQIPVTDGALNAQTTLSFIKQLAETVRQTALQADQYERQGQQLLTEYNQLVTLGKQLETMALNLKRMPQELNFSGDILAYGQKLIGILDATTGMSFTLDRATQQFTDAFERLDCSATDSDVLAAFAAIDTLQMGTARTGIQLQSIASSLSDTFGRLCALLGGIFGASGNLDTLQEAAQQQALTQQLAAQATARQAASERAQALTEARRVFADRMAVCMHERFYSTTTIQNTPHTVSGFLHFTPMR